MDIFKEANSISVKKIASMFAGHFGVAFGMKRAAPTISLGMLFFAAQWLDLLWPVLILTGTEHAVIAPGLMEGSPLDFIYYPFSHSLLMVIAWAILISFLFGLITSSYKNAWVIGACVVSHWLLDLLVHRPDLPLLPDDTFKTGLGLWHSRTISLLTETVIYAGGVWLYLSSTKTRSLRNRIALWSLIVFIYLIQLANMFGPPPASMQAVAWAGMLQWILVWWAWMVDRKRLLHAQLLNPEK